MFRPVQSAPLIFFSCFILAGDSDTAPFRWAYYSGIGGEALSSSTAAWADYDQDGDPDLFIASPLNENNLQYENLGNGVFRKVETGDTVMNAGNSSGAVWGDYNNDGHPDLFVANQDDHDNFLYHNDGHGRFTRITTGSIVSNFGDSYAAAWGDYDNDGFLDLYVANLNKQANFLYHNEGNGTFTRVKQGPHVEDLASSYSANWVDIDGDGDLDLFVPNFDEDVPNALYRNLGNGQFESVTAGPLVEDRAKSSGACWGDYDNDGDLDVFISNGGYFHGQEQVNALYRNDGRGNFTRITMGDAVNDANSALTAQWGDVDNDGDLDLFVAVFRDNNLLYRNGGGRLVKVHRGHLLEYGGYTDSAAFADADGDGHLDLVITHWEHQSNRLFLNTGSENHWLRVKLIGSRSNRQAIGAKVTLESMDPEGVSLQFREISSQTGGRGQNETCAHFGLGPNRTPKSLKIQWPSGETTLIEEPRPDHTLVIHETRGLLQQHEAKADTTAPRDMLAKIYQNKGLVGLHEQATALLETPAGKTQVDASRWISLAYYLADNPDNLDQLLQFGQELFPHAAHLPFARAELRRADGNNEAGKFYHQAAILVAEDPTISEGLRTWIRQESKRYAGLHAP